MENMIAAREKTLETVEDVRCIEVPCQSEIHISGVETLAKAAVLPYTIKPWRGYTESEKDCPDAEVYTCYRGYKFFELQRGVYK